MPQLTKPSPRTELLRQTTVEEIEHEYREGRITAGDRNRLFREKGRASVAQLLEEKAYPGALFAQTIQHLNGGWENLKAAAIREPTTEAKTEAYNIGLAI